MDDYARMFYQLFDPGHLVDAANDPENGDDMKPCIEPGCEGLSLPGPRHSRCRAHERQYQAARDRRPERAVYRDPAYQAMPSLTGTAVQCAIRDPYVCTIWATTWDHIVPASQGGSNSWANLQPACRACNSAKANR